MKKYFSVFILVLVCVFTAGMAAINQPLPETVSAAAFPGDEIVRDLCVTATSTVKVSPDFANISFTIETKSLNLNEAQSENAERVQNLIASLKEQKINESDIKAAGFYIYPEYDYSYGQRFTGYKVSNQISVKVKEINNLGKIIDSATHSGVNTVNGIQFMVEDSSSAYNNALEKACELAKEKAAVLSRAADIKEIKIISIKEISNNFYAGYERASFAKSFDAGAMIHTQIMQGEIEITAAVEIKYQLIQSA